MDTINTLDLLLMVGIENSNRSRNLLISYLRKIGVELTLTKPGTPLIMKTRDLKRIAEHAPLSSNDVADAVHAAVRKMHTDAQVPEYSSVAVPTTAVSDPSIPIPPTGSDTPQASSALVETHPPPPPIVSDVKKKSLTKAGKKPLKKRKGRNIIDFLSQCADEYNKANAPMALVNLKREYSHVQRSQGLTLAQFVRQKYPLTSCHQKTEEKEALWTWLACILHDSSFSHLVSTANSDELLYGAQLQYFNRLAW